MQGAAKQSEAGSSPLSLLSVGSLYPSLVQPLLMSHLTKFVGEGGLIHSLRQDTVRLAKFSSCSSFTGFSEWYN